MKKFLFLLLVLFTVIFISFKFKTTNRKILYISNTDINYLEETLDYYKSNDEKVILNNILHNNLYRTPDYIKMIESNIKIDTQNTPIKNEIIKSDTIVIAISPSEYSYYLNTNPSKMVTNMNIVHNDTTNLIKLLREYSKEKIIMIGIFNLNENNDNYEMVDLNLKRLNNLLKETCQKYKIDYIDIYDLVEKKDNNITQETIKRINSLVKEEIIN